MMTGSLGLALLDLGQQFEAALAGQGEVEQDEIEAFQFEHAQALLAVVASLDGVALEREQDFERLADAALRRR